MAGVSPADNSKSDFKNRLRCTFLRNASGEILQIGDLKFGRRYIAGDPIITFPNGAKYRSHSRAAKKAQCPDSGSEPFRAAEFPSVRCEIANSVPVAGIE